MKADDLEDARKRLRKSKAAMARALDIAINTYRQYELGQRPIPSWLAYSVAWILLMGERTPWTPPADHDDEAA